MDQEQNLSPETVCRTHEDSQIVISEKVKSLASSIYQEFERMIARYDEDVVKNLMPLLVNVLECLEAAYHLNHEQEVEVELLREEYEQLETQYEREKEDRKASEQKLLEVEQNSEAEKKEFLVRQEALESIARILELKHMNSKEYCTRLEEKEGELRKKYVELHERYSEFTKTHMDYMERTQFLLSGGQNANEHSEGVNSSRTSSISMLLSSPSSTSNNARRVHNKTEISSRNKLYQDPSLQDVGTLTDLDNRTDHASSVDDNFYGMGKDVEKLIMENSDLREMKNALNDVKDNLMVQVDSLTGDLENVRGEILSLNLSRTKVRGRVTELEEELKNMKKAQQAKLESEPLAHRKRFTRVEMARVVMERNQYKERFMELREELMRATKQDPDIKNKQGIRKFFNSLFSSNDRAPGPVVETQIRDQPNANQIMPGVRALLRTGQDTENTADYLATERAGERREQYRQVRAHVRKEACGWSFPDKVGPSAKAPQNISRVPAPVPLLESLDGQKICCAAAVNLMGGYTKDGRLMVGGSEFQSNDLYPFKMATETKLDRKILSLKKRTSFEAKLSSLVWICSFQKDTSTVTVIDANNPDEILNSFEVCTDELLCIASVPGASPTDYENTKYITSDNQKSQTGNSNKENDEEKGVMCKVTFVENTEDEANPDYTNQKNDTSGNSNRDSEVNDANVSSVLATMWLGTMSGEIFVHSTVTAWNRCLHSVKLKESILNIVHINGRVLIALADGTVAVFSRDENGEWNLSKYNIVEFGLLLYSINCLLVVGDKVWCGYRNKVCVLNPITLNITHTFTANSRKDNQVKQIAWLGEGVWLSVRLGSIIRLYHAQTYQHLQDVDFEPCVSKMLNEKYFTLVRITALFISSNRLWIGTSNGLRISVPLGDSECSDETIVSKVSGLPGNGVRVGTLPRHSVPFCNVELAQLSFYRHPDSVNFFVAVPGSGGMNAAYSQSEAETPINSPPKLPSAMLVISGSESYIDFRIGNNDMGCGKQ